MMTERVSGRSVPFILAGIAAALLLGAAAVSFLQPSTAPPEVAAKVREDLPKQALRPSLDCSFTAFMHASTAVYFYFDVVVSEGETPRFYERAVVSADGERTNFEGDERPVWTYSLDEEGQQTIASPDGATRIVLYGLKLGAPGVLPVEAGMRSNVLRNLGGQCRQTNLSGK